MMNKNVWITVGILFAALLIWMFVFNGGGALQTAVNAGVRVINGVWETVTGDDTLLPEWGGSDGPEFEGEDSNLDDTSW